MKTFFKYQIDLILLQEMGLENVRVSFESVMQQLV